MSVERTPTIGYLYEGKCNVCGGKWTMVLETPDSFLPSPETFTMECPIPWCGSVEMTLKERRENGTSKV